MLGGLIDVLDTSNYHCACVVPKHALKYMIMCNSNFDHNYLKTRYFKTGQLLYSTYF